MLWFSVNNVPGLQKSISTIGATLGLTRPDVYSNDFFALFRGWLLDPANGEWLIVLDGFDFAQRPLERMDAELLLEAIPVISRGSTILTLRHAGILDREFNTEWVTPFSEEQAIA